MAALSCTREQALFANSNRNTVADLQVLENRFPGAIVCPTENGVGYDIIERDDCGVTAFKQGDEFVFTNQYGQVEHLSCH